MSEGTQGSSSETRHQTNNSEVRLLTDERFLRRVAFLYYEDGHSQETIADMEFCSRQTVSKALQKAKDKGIVRISIVPDLRTGYIRNLSREVRVQLGLEDLVLVPGQNLNTISAQSHHQDVVTEITKHTAEYLDQLLIDNDVLAISGGSIFMRNIIPYLKPAKPLPHLQVVATIGFVEVRTSPGDANMIAYDLAKAYGARHLWFPCPAVLPDKTLLEQTRNLPIIKEAYQMMLHANIIVTALWSPFTNNNMVKRGVLTQEQLKKIEAYQPVVDINHWVFNAAGECLNEIIDDFPYALTGMEIPGIRERILEHKIKSILVAGGSPAYVPAIRAALKAGLANILITDHITAQFLLMAE